MIFQRDGGERDSGENLIQIGLYGFGFAFAGIVLLMREANTVGSKSAAASLTQEVVGLKSEIERFREQVQNVE